MNILAFAEQRSGSLKKASLEVLGVARRLADASSGSVAAVLLGGPGVSGSAEALGQSGADRVFLGEDALFEPYSGDAYMLAVAKAFQSGEFGVVLFPATAMGKDLAPRVSAKLDIGLVSDVTEVLGEGDGVRFKRPIYAGKAYSTLAPKPGKAYAVSLRPNVFPAGESARSAEVIPLDHGVASTDIRALVERLATAEGGLLDVAEADIIVSGGRGMKGPENFPMIQELAEAFGGAMGASRAAVDAGWIDHAHQVGQTGKVVSPSLYIACGISGAIQHLAGMSTSKVIVAVNKDPEAPIFKVASYGIVGDLFEIVPKLTAAVKELESS